MLDCYQVPVYSINLLNVAVLRNIIVCIETSDVVCSVAIGSSNSLIGEFNIIKKNSHSDIIEGVFLSLMKNSSFSINDIAAISVSMGPGSYTGLRIGVSFAKGLAMGLKIPIISVSTFDGLIAQVTDFFSSDFLFCPLIDARRNEVYTTIKCKNGEVIMPICCKILKDDSFFSILEQRRVVFFGSGAQKLPLSVTKNKNAILVEGILPNARGLFDISSKKFNAKNFEDINTFEPLYLKEFDRIIVKS